MHEGGEGESRFFLSKHRLEALSDGIYAIALTLLVLDLKVPVLSHGAGDEVLRQALVELVPRGLTWLLSFWVMAMFWLAQLRLYRMMAGLDPVMLWSELILLALVSLLPFSTALIGEHGDLVSAQVVYAGHVLAIALAQWVRSFHFRAHPELHSQDWTAEMSAQARVRINMLVACALATFVLAFFYPRHNTLAMLPIAFSGYFRRKAAPAPLKVEPLDEPEI